MTAPAGLPSEDPPPFAAAPTLPVQEITAAELVTAGDNLTRWWAYTATTAGRYGFDTFLSSGGDVRATPMTLAVDGGALPTFMAEFSESTPNAFAGWLWADLEADQEVLIGASILAGDESEELVPATLVVRASGPGSVGPSPPVDYDVVTQQIVAAGSGAASIPLADYAQTGDLVYVIGSTNTIPPPEQRITCPIPGTDTDLFVGYGWASEGIDDGGEVPIPGKFLGGKAVAAFVYDESWPNTLNAVAPGAATFGLMVVRPSFRWVSYSWVGNAHRTYASVNDVGDHWKLNLDAIPPFPAVAESFTPSSTYDELLLSNEELGGPTWFAINAGLGDEPEWAHGLGLTPGLGSGTWAYAHGLTSDLNQFLGWERDTPEANSAWFTNLSIQQAMPLPPPYAPWTPPDVPVDLYGLPVRIYPRDDASSPTGPARAYPPPRSAVSGRITGQP